MTFGSLFAGIGGMDLGLERAGLQCRWQVEIDDYARRVLARHWPDVHRHDDVRTFATDDDISRYRVDLIAGGFPCQDISFAGKGAGLAGERSGLWYEFARVIRVLRPRCVLVENVAALLVRGLDAVLGTLASLGYDAEWCCLPAAAVGAPHQRDRVFIAAHAASVRSAQVGYYAKPRSHCKTEGKRGLFEPVRMDRDARTLETSLPNAHCEGLAFGCSIGGNARQELAAFERANRQAGGQWAADPADDPESGVGRVAHGVPHRVDRLRGLGNAVVPQVAEFIGRRILLMQEAMP